MRAALWSPLTMPPGRRLAPLALALLGTAWTPALRAEGAPPPPVFQGLPWGAGELRIAERFGERLEPGRCDDAAERAEAERAGEWCGSPRVPRYEVAGIPFELRLHLGAADRRLVRITLTWSGEPGTRPADSRWSEHHRVLRRLLTQRYGGAEFNELHQEAGVATAHARWRTGLALIDLVSTAPPRGGAGREQVQVRYQSPLHGEAAKL